MDTESEGEYLNRHEEEFSDSYFKQFGQKTVSSLGVGTEPGDATSEVDESYHDALVYALENGINVLDTSITYRHQRSERVVGEAISDADVDRSEVFIATKGGFIPYDEQPPSDRESYIEQEFIEPGLVTPADLVEDVHTVNPDFLDRMIDMSKENLGVRSIDLYYLHNPERQLEKRSREEVYDQIERAFELLEIKVNSGDISHYGVASWESFRVPRDADEYLSLQEIVNRAQSAARTVGNSDHGLAAIELPFNLVMTEASDLQEQPIVREDSSGEFTKEVLCSTLKAADELGLEIFTSASLNQEYLVEGVPEQITSQFSGNKTSQSAINFIRAHPEITAALVGMDKREFVEENIVAGRFSPV